MEPSVFKPKLFTTLKNYSFKQLRADCLAGLIVGIVALPLAIAFAIASGVTPDRGLITAVIAGFLISALGGSRVQIGGPTGAFVVIVYSIVQKFGVDGLIMATFLGGLIMLLMGCMRLGVVIKFIPYPLTVGFTSGIALIIFSSQIKDFLGLAMPVNPAEFLEKWRTIFEHLHTANLYALGLSIGTIMLILVWQKYIKAIPGAVIALVLGTAVTHLFHLPVETIQTQFGSIPQHIPHPRMPVFHVEQIKLLMPAALTIALLGSIESLLSAVVADGMIGGRHRSNTELIAQGCANVASSLFGGMPATGAIARTATNVHNGGRTPVAGIVHAFTVLISMVILGKWLVYIPMAVLAAILVLVAYRMSEWKSFVMILRSPKSDVAILATTFLLTVLIDLTVAIQVGVVLSALLFMNRLANVANISVITKEFTDEEDRDDPLAISRRQIPDGVEVYEINGPFFFGIVSTFIQTMSEIDSRTRVRILRMRHVLSIDAAALNALRQAFLLSQKNNIHLVLSGIHAQPLMAIQKDGLYDEIGEDNICHNIDASLQRAAELLSQPGA
ncbi:MAG TPA: sulfate permease [Candidatus Omnitrophota bacterium]|nr:sulfate permease [Candidatus Omnitrophota bacterium]